MNTWEPLSDTDTPAEKKRKLKLWADYCDNLQSADEEDAQEYRESNGARDRAWRRAGF